MPKTKEPSLRSPKEHKVLRLAIPADAQLLTQIDLYRVTQIPPPSRPVAALTLLRKALDEVLKPDEPEEKGHRCPS